MTSENKQTTKKPSVRKSRTSVSHASADKKPRVRTATASRKAVTKPRVSSSRKKKMQRPSWKSRLGLLLKKWIMPDGEVAPWVIWTCTSLVILAYIVVAYFFFFRPYMDGKREKELYFHRPQVHGVDISHYQGDINWSKLSQAVYENSTINFVFMKATEGGDYVDDTFQQNFAAARDCGLVRGAYHFYQPSVPAELQVASFIRQVKLLPGDLPPVLDVEVLGEGGVGELQRGVKVWLKRVEEHYGVKPIIYASHSFKEDYLNDPFFDDYPYWIAHYYVDSLKYKGPWRFWQHTDMGILDGVNGHVDLDVFNGNLEELMQMTIR